MINADSSTDIQTLDAAASVLLRRVHAALAETNGHPCVRRVAVPVTTAASPLQWLRAQTEKEAFYWSHRDEDTPDVAGYGSADTVSVSSRPLDYDELWTALRPCRAGADASVRYYGGIRFDARHAERSPDALWQPFGTARFVLPRVEMISDGAESALVCNLVLPRDRDRQARIAETLETLHAPSTRALRTPPLPLSRTDAPDEQQWTQGIRWALQTFERTALRKVVFARRVLLQLERRMDPLNVLAHLAQGTPKCTHFAVRPVRGTAFIGASPERLFRQSGARIVSEAVAGTRPRGDTPTQDAALRRELLTSDKDRREHAFVTTAIGDALRPLCHSVRTGDVTELRLARGRHLRARLDGTLRDAVRPVDLLSALHPTPAVAGVPTETALTAIARHEPFDRGWYAGPVGWIGQDAAEFTVAIRSGLVRDDRLALYSGAGIVEGSDPQREWREIEQKLGDFAAVLGIHD